MTIQIVLMYLQLSIHLIRFGDETMPRKKKSVITTKETSPDIALVEKAQQKLSDIISQHYGNAMLEAGKYIIDEFFGGDYDLARSGKPVKEKSLRQMIKQMRQRNPSGPSRSWIYHAVQLSVEHQDLMDVQTYGQLDLSKKILLLPLHNLEKKKELIEETVENDLSVRELKERIAEVKEEDEEDRPQKTKSTAKLLKEAIGKPDRLFSEEFSPHIKFSGIKDIRPDIVVNLKSKAEGQVSKINSEIEQFKHEIEKRKYYLNEYDKLIKRFEKKVDETNSDG